MAEVIVAGRIRPDGVASYHVDVIVVGPGAVGHLPYFKAAQQGRRPHDDLGPFDGQHPRQLREITVIADDHADGAQLGLEHGRFSPWGAPAAAREPLGGEEVGLTIDADDLALRVDKGRRVVNHAPLRTPLVSGQYRVNPQAASGADDGFCDPAGDGVYQVPQFLGPHPRRKAGGDRLGEENEVGLILLDCPFQPGFDFFQVFGYSVGGSGDLGTSGNETFHLTSFKLRAAMQQFTDLNAADRLGKQVGILIRSGPQCFIVREQNPSVYLCSSSNGIVTQATTLPARVFGYIGTLFGPLWYPFLSVLFDPFGHFGDLVSNLLVEGNQSQIVCLNEAPYFCWLEIVSELQPQLANSLKVSDGGYAEGPAGKGGA